MYADRGLVMDNHCHTCYIFILSLADMPQGIPLEIMAQKKKGKSADQRY
jgi:hypothetical protein